ncbi:MAG: nicotinate-nucleotide diphosphorylase (carboxylating) [Dehalococcoidia bacterium]|nr:MAG: nicotinate-nucleotide diphosphorylase (carboxylating) [Dehalococcoidia bacterium]
MCTFVIEDTLDSEIERFLNEDISNGDITSDLFIDATSISNAEILSREPGILSGRSEITQIFNHFNIESNWLFQDGNSFSDNSQIVKLNGLSKSILLSERVSLNLLGHMSGIATSTNNAVKITKQISPHTNISATRKTLPGLRKYEKYSVIVGGGLPHRYDLNEMILIKDNHSKLINNLQKSISSVRNQIGSSKKIELEVDSLESAMKAINLDIDIILLDNMQPEDILKFMNKIKSISQKIPLTEASGGITMSNLQNYASTGVDIISMGALTHSSKSINFSLQII